jgi:hypothetical protein
MSLAGDRVAAPMRALPPTPGRWAAHGAWLAERRRARIALVPAPCHDGENATSDTASAGGVRRRGACAEPVAHAGAVGWATIARPRCQPSYNGSNGFAATGFAMSASPPRQPQSCGSLRQPTPTPGRALSSQGGTRLPQRFHSGASRATCAAHLPLGRAAVDIGVTVPKYTGEPGRGRAEHARGVP